MHIVYFFSLKAEAEPWLNAAPYKLNKQYKSIVHFTGQLSDVVVTGIGSNNMAAAVGYIAAFHQNKHLLWVNIGCAAAPQQFYNHWFQLAAISHANGGRTIYPEILTHLLPLASAKTVHQFTDEHNVIEHQKTNLPTLVEMEAYAFAQTVKQFADTSHMLVLKWVSDWGDAQFYKNKDWTNHYVQNVASVNSAVAQHHEKLMSNFNQHHPLIDDYLTLVQQQMPLSFTQQNQLKNALYYALAYKNPEEIAKILSQEQEILKHKKQNTTSFRQILDNLQHG
jgi:nucleoside phosphorylase